MVKTRFQPAPTAGHHTRVGDGLITVIGSSYDRRREVETILVIFRATALILTAATIYLLWVVVDFLLLPIVGYRLRWHNFMIRNWGQLVAKILGLSIEVRGEPPRPPFFLVSNHLSYIDIIAYAACLGCLFVGKNEIRSWPFIGWIARSIGTIFIERANFQDLPRVIRLINKRLDDGLGIVLFAEGTSTKGDKVLPFNPALLEPAVRGNYPVSYASISYRTPPDEIPAHISVCWWEDITLLSHAARLLKLPKFSAVLTFGSHAIQADNRKTLAKSLWVAVNDQFIPVVEPSSDDHEPQRRRER
jgi:1-acyl-sn-glycerol-3-phosphate acyltransferase